MKNIEERLELLNTELSQKTELCLSRGVLNKFPAILHNPFRSPGIGVIVCLKGQFSFELGSVVYMVHAGETAILSEDVVFGILTESDDLEVRFLFYGVESIRGYLGYLVQKVQLYVKMSPVTYYVWKTYQEDELIGYMNLLESTTMLEDSRFMEGEKKLLLMSLTFRLCSIFQQKFLSSTPVTQRCTDVFLQLIELIDRHYKTERSVQFYADKLCLSSKYLSELSRSVCGYTVHELIFKAIIRGVMASLTGSSKTIQEISADFHFPNPSSFGTFFKKHTGVSPQKYREMNFKE